MDSFEFNKIAGAVLGTALFVLLVSFLSGEIFASHAPETPVYLANLASEEGQDGGTPAPVAAEESIGMLMASADVAGGESVFKKCKACHSVEDGKNGTGPSLWNVVDRPIASVDGYSYSRAFVEFAEGGKAWDYEALNAFLIKPKAYINGTKMAFGGLSKGKDRADLILYLRSLSGSPAPMPAASDSAGMAEEKPVEVAAMTPEGNTGMAASDGEMPAMEESVETMAAAPPAESAVTETGTDATAETASEMATETPAETNSTETDMAANSTGGEAADGVLAMIAGQDLADGEKVFRKCKACHTAEEGGKNKVGPALWNIVNRPVAIADGYRYSDALKGHAEGGTVWTYAELDSYLAAPKTYIPGNKMSFSGLKNEKDRAAILAYLRTLATDPAPLP